MPKFNLYAGLTVGFNSAELVEKNVECESLKEAEMFAYEYALSKFDDMSGTHGLKSYTDIENELKEEYGDYIEFDDIVLEEYLSYADRWISYYAKEVENESISRVYKDELIKIWRRTTYEVDSQNKEKILKMIKNDELDILDSEILSETEEIIETEILDENLELMMKLE